LLGPAISRTIYKTTIYSRETAEPSKMVPVEIPAETQTSIQLAGFLVRAPISRSGGQEFEPQCGGNSVH
jgi:hypothetical protein